VISATGTAVENLEMISLQGLKYASIALCVLSLVVYASIVVMLLKYVPEIPQSRFLGQANHNYKYLDVGSVRLRYFKREGDEPYLVFLHGFASDLNRWNPIIEQFPNAGIIAFDIVGFGGSDRPPLDYTLDTQAEYIIAALKQLNTDKVILVGHSMGGSLSARIAAETPDLVAGLVLIAPSGYPGSLNLPWPASQLFKPGWINTLCFKIATDQLFRTLFPDYLAMQMLGVTGSYNQNFVNHLRNIHTKTLLFWSAGDARVLPDYKERYLELLAQAKYVPLPVESAHTTNQAEKMIAENIKAYFQMNPTSR